MPENNTMDFFKKYITEADGDGIDEMPDFAPPAGGEESPAPDDTGDAPVDEAPDIGGVNFDSSETDFDSFGEDEGGEENTGEESGEENNDGDTQKRDPHLSDKVSDIMNMNIYQKFLVLLTKISNQINSIKTNQDILNQLYPDIADYIASLVKLEENVQLYLSNQFMNENAGKNILFFNKALNLLKLLNDKFDKNISKGIKDVE